MTGRKVFEIWAPYGKPWTNYARPVAFININEFMDSDYKYFFVPTINYLKKFEKNAAIIVDMPCEYGIEEGLGIAQLGYRPIPLYNGTNEPVGSMPTTDNRALEKPLSWGATILKDMEFEEDAPPVFLIDLNRQNRYKMDVSVFDNSYDMYGQDFPSAGALLENGIDKVIIRTTRLQKDMRLILFEYQKKGIKIFHADGFDEPKEIKVRKPLFYRN